ncbi:cysteine protease ATG4A [Hypomesus transpacificus]|uniref:cysteine protease ATG4A n=1 Tax=Hypomesus transpacificus TaxID=137520 RepID=UPI001F0734E3|nr:cysteine protease ATG4A [Hypomesus transpacificus]
MEAVFAKYENQINVFSEFLEDLPDTEEPVWVLGKSYNVKTERAELLSDIQSRLWFSYRKKFCPIGGTGPSSDAGWGCMLRCGQMILAQALLCSHLGRAWRWRGERGQPEDYTRILHCFLDKKDCCYSIHQMAQMGVGEGKSVGEWYGPNTVAQVLKKLVLFDDWNSLAVYVSMDNTVVIEDIKKQCLQPGSGSRLRPSCGWGEVFPPADSPSNAPDHICFYTAGKQGSVCPHSHTHHQTHAHTRSQPRTHSQHKTHTHRHSQPPTHTHHQPHTHTHHEPHTHKPSQPHTQPHSQPHTPHWKPLLLVIPLRMGINNINPVYIQALKECFKMPQSCGVLGGKPNLAYYFIGSLGEELLYLDPHTTQTTVEVEPGVAMDDHSYHWTRTPRHMKITSLDPSVSLGFFCQSEEDFDSWCYLVQQEILKKTSQRMFELVENHPPHWPPFVPPTKPEVHTTGAEFIESPDQLLESEEEFEILNV